MLFVAIVIAIVVVVVGAAIEAMDNGWLVGWRSVRRCPPTSVNLFINQLTNRKVTGSQNQATENQAVAVAVGVAASVAATKTVLLSSP